MRAERGAITGKVLVLSVVAVLVLEAVLRVMPAMVPANRILFLGLIRLLQTGALIGVVAMLEGGLAAIGLQKQSLYQGLQRGLLWSAGFGIAALVVLGLLLMAGIEVRPFLHTRLPASLKDLVLFFVVGGLVAPVAEELFFRGILYGFFRRWGVIAALVLSTGFFLMAHPLKGAFPVTQLAGGILFAVAYEAEGSLMVPIVIHIIGNMGIFAVSLVI